MDFSPICCDEAAYIDYARLFAKCFPSTEKYSRNYLDWLYHRNPDGQVVGYDARDGDRLVAHYACIPAQARIGGKDVKVLLSLNTATHPDYQGKGLFTQLAERTYAAGLAQGYDCVYGIANANSTPGFIRKLKFQLVGPLRAMVGLGSLGIDFANLPVLQFQRLWSPQALAWRCASPVNPVIARKKHDYSVLLAPALLGGICMAVAEIGDTATIAESPVDAMGGFASPLRLFIGLVPSVAQNTALYVDIPQKLRPSPLNLIYRSLSERVESIDPSAVFLNFLDFDAY